MTAPGNLICSKCGFSNVPGDQFCGSCGAFLEWEGVAAADAAAAPPPSDVPVVGPRPGADGGTQATPPIGGPPAVTTAPIPPTGSAAALIRCPACGIANTAGRTFCQSCGTKLPEAAVVKPATPEQIAAAITAPYPAPGAQPRAAASDPAEPSGRGGLLKWLVLVGVLGLVAGVAVVVGGSLLKGTASSEASLNPSVGVVPPSGSATGSGAPVASGGASGSPQVSAAPAVSVPLSLTGATASSVVGDLSKFQPGKAIDGDPTTCWQEGNTREKGEWIEVTLAPAKVTALILTNGYNASRALFKGNLRLKDIEISIDGGAAIPARLKDVGTPQRIPVTPVDAATTIRITIVSTYPSVKTSVSGTPFDDAALGEIVVMGVTAP
jgi:hypothetical protein